MNRTALGLAVGAGYLLGRTRKMKLALAVGAMAAGKKLPLSPGALKDVLTRQMADNPAFKELGTQLRGNLREAGRAASGALVERRMTSLADRLADRTRTVRGRTAGGAQEEAPRDTAEEVEAAGDGGNAGNADDAEDARDAKGAEDTKNAKNTKNAKEAKNADDTAEETGRRTSSAAERGRRTAKEARRPAAGGAARAAGTARKAAPAQRAPQKTAKQRTTARKKTAGGRSGEGRR